MVDVHALRRLGAEGLAELLSTRPDVLGPVPPRSMTELAARLGHRGSVLHALSRMDRPTLQVTEAVAALMLIRGEVRRAELNDLLGVAGAGGDMEAIDRAVAHLRRCLLLGPAASASDAMVAVPGLLAALPHPLGLQFPISRILIQLPVTSLRAALTLWRAPTAGRKSDLVDQLQALFNDTEELRHELARAPRQVAERLRAAAHEPVAVDSGVDYGGGRSPMQWALDRFLLVRVSWEGQSWLPAEVTLALRGPGWSAPFDPTPPVLPWVVVPQPRIDGDAAAAAGQALRVTADLLRVAERTPIALLKDASLGVRELRRLAKLLGVSAGEVRFVVAVTYEAQLLSWSEAGLVPTRLADHWASSSPARRVAALTSAWLTISTVVLTGPDRPWLPGGDDGAGGLRWSCLAALSALPGKAPADPAALAEWAAWRLPWAAAPDPASTGAAPAGAGRAGSVGDALQPAAVAAGLLQEAAWLGVTGAGALSRAGLALADEGDLLAALDETLGEVHETARLQGDMTAVVLGHPSAMLAATLDALAVREAGSTATTWRFSVASVRAALDAGESADTINAALERVSAGDIPQPLTYLVNDTARAHGRVRAGEAACYLRSEDVATLAQAVADSRLRTMGLRSVAPGVVVGARPLDETLAAMRRAGYSPVEESTDGSVRLVRPVMHRAGPEIDPGSAAELMADVVVEAGADEGVKITLVDVARELLTLPDRPPGRLLELDGTIVDLESLHPDLLPGLDDE